METTIHTDHNTVYIHCPNCDNWEGLGIDDARHYFHDIEILEWLPDREDKPERSINKCSACEEEFTVIWDYPPVTLEIKEDEWEGPDASIEISLFEYGIIWQKNDECEPDELCFIAEVPFEDQRLYDSGYVSEDDFDWADIDGILSWNGLTKEEWDELPLGQKVQDVCNYHGSNNLFTTYGATPENEIELL